MENRPFSIPGPQGGETPLALQAHNDNIFLIDWLTVTVHGETVDYIKWILGLDDPSIPWEVSEKFRNGYPCSQYWSGITISYGADDPRYYKDPDKVRHDMGICVNLSGKGCRAFESHGHGDWWKLFRWIFRDTSKHTAEYLTFKRCNITRLDLAYDDHIGILDIQTIAQDTRDRNYLSKSKKSEIVWSDNQETDIQGLTIQIGSDKSEIKIRIYDKAAERGFKDRHWIRTELQLRDDRATAACQDLLNQQHVGRTTVAILRNYLTFRTPTADTNKSRWAIAPYWEKLLFTMERLRLWKTPGEEYNFSRTEHFLLHQYGPALVVLSYVEDLDYVTRHAKQLFPVDELAPKYQEILQKHWKKLRLQREKEVVQDDTAPIETAYQISFGNFALVDQEEAGLPAGW